MTLTVSLSIKKPSKGAKNLPDEIKLGDNATTEELLNLVSKETKLNTNRIRLTVKSELSSDKGKKDVALRKNDSLSQFAVDENVHVFVRDLGPQISWKSVIFIEYIGPLLISPIFFFCPKLIYGVDEGHTYRQWLIFIAVMLHYIKREYETLFVHKFSLATMPVFNLFKNCGHYWLLCGCLVSYFGYAPPSWSESGSKLDRFLFYNKGIIPGDGTWSLILSWLVAEGSNYATHLNLASLRAPGTTERKIPYGYGFTNVSCPNYFFEFWGWVTLFIISGNWAMGVFTVVGGIKMYFWAVKKHKRYLKEFPNYPKQRGAFFPSIF